MKDNPNNKTKSSFRLRIEQLAIFSIFGPFALVLLFGLTGENMPTEGWFSVWFVGSFAFCSIFVLVSELSGLWKNKPVEWGCAIPFALVSWWAITLFLKELEYFW